MGYSPEERRCPGDLVHIQGLPAPSSGMVRPDEQDIKQRWKRLSWVNMELLTKLKQKKRSIEKVEAGRGDPGEIQRHLSKHAKMG